jgi:hypothetical protein
MRGSPAERRNPVGKRKTWWRDGMPVDEDEWGSGTPDAR